jgi:hypothetical protein
MGDFTLTSYLILAGCVVVVALMVGQSWVVLNLLRQNGRLLLRLEALEKHLGLADSTTEMAQAKTAPQGLAVGTLHPPFDYPRWMAQSNRWRLSWRLASRCC